MDTHGDLTRLKETHETSSHITSLKTLSNKELAYDIKSSLFHVDFEQADSQK